MSLFYKGQLVECIRQGPCPLCGDIPPLLKGRIYTVIDGYVDHEFPDMPAIVVDTAPMSWGTDDPKDHDGYLCEWFRPVDESRIDPFRVLLADPGEIPGDGPSPYPAKELEKT